MSVRGDDGSPASIPIPGLQFGKDEQDVGKKSQLRGRRPRFEQVLLRGWWSEKGDLANLILGTTMNRIISFLQKRHKKALFNLPTENVT